MATFKIIPLDMISAPNYFADLPDTQWVIVGNNAATLWFQFEITDSLGTRRYLVANPGSVTLTFMRADTPGVPPSAPPQAYAVQTPVSSFQSIIRAATPYTTDRSLFSLALSAQDATSITSGTVQVTLTENGVPITFNQNYLVKKTLAAAGC